MSETDQQKRWDAFICHASEDKVAFVQPLATALQAAGLNVWYDKCEITLGDSLRRKIDEGLANSRYGIVVLSSAFFAKEWPQHELDGLVQREMRGKKVILPIWHGINSVEIERHSPPLAARYAAMSKEPMDEIVQKIRTVVQSSAPSSKQGPPNDQFHPLQKTGTWIMLGDHFFLANCVRRNSSGKLEISIVADNAEDEASLAALRPSQYGGGTTLPFAAKNDAHAVRVKHIETETVNGCQTWMLSLEEDREHWGGGITSEMSYCVDDKTHTPDDIAKLRAGRILLNDTSPKLVRHRGLGNETLLNGMIEDSCSRYPVRECVVRSVFNSHGQSPNWRTFARLRSVFLLKAAGIVEHILELKIGAVRDNKVSVSFRGRRPQHYSNVPPETIGVSGICSVA